jgi:hypothetical protein
MDLDLSKMGEEKGSGLGRFFHKLTRIKRKGGESEEKLDKCLTFTHLVF